MFYIFVFISVVLFILKKKKIEIYYIFLSFDLLSINIDNNNEIK